MNVEDLKRKTEADISEFITKKWTRSRSVLKKVTRSRSRSCLF